MKKPKEVIDRLTAKTQDDRKVGLSMVVIRLADLEWLLLYIKELEERDVP